MVLCWFPFTIDGNARFQKFPETKDVNLPHPSSWTSWILSADPNRSWTPGQGPQVSIASQWRSATILWDVDSLWTSAEDDWLTSLGEHKCLSVCVDTTFAGQLQVVPRPSDSPLRPQNKEPSSLNRRQGPSPLSSFLQQENCHDIPKHTRYFERKKKAVSKTDHLGVERKHLS